MLGIGSILGLLSPHSSSPILNKHKFFFFFYEKKIEGKCIYNLMLTILPFKSIEYLKSQCLSILEKIILKM